MKARLVKKGRQTNKLLRQLNQKISVQVGHFEDQGQHYSGMTYPELMELHHNGTGLGKGEIPSRPVLNILAFRVDQSKKKIFFGVSNVFKEGSYSEKVKAYLLKTGETIKKMEKDILGNTSVLKGNSDMTLSLKQNRNTPLVDTGDLRDKIEVRIKK